MREITTHLVDGEPGPTLNLFATDGEGPGGANHRYLIQVPVLMSGDTEIVFQNGPVGEHGANGLTQEVLLAIVVDRLEAFQRGPFACKENAEALKHVEAALEALQIRTRQRIKRGVEGTSEV